MKPETPDTPVPARTENTTPTQPLARRSDLRWLALAATGGAATLAASTGNADAVTVQIDLIGNQMTSAGVSLNADLTGDGMNDIVYQNAYGQANLAGFLINPGYSISAAFFGATYKVQNWSANLGQYLIYFGATPQTATGLLPVSFTDASINGGATTLALLEIQTFNTSTTSHSTLLTRLIFDDAGTARPTDAMAGGSNTSIGSTENGVFTAVPEPSRLALLTLGAAGILARRRRTATAA